MDAQPKTQASADKRVLPARVICVLWHAPGREIDPELADVLKRWQGLLVTQCSSAPAAIAHLTSLERAMRAGTREAAVLLLVEPERLPGVCDVLCAMDKFCPTTRPWCYESGSPEMLRAITPADIARLTRVTLQKQQAKRPGTTPQVHVVARAEQLGSARQQSGAQAGPQSKPQSKPPELKLAQSGDSHSLLEKAAPFVVPIVPHLNLQTPGELDNNQFEIRAKSSDNRENPTQRNHNAISNVLTPDEMAMLLADDDKGGHTS